MQLSLLKSFTSIFGTVGTTEGSSKAETGLSSPLLAKWEILFDLVLELTPYPPPHGPARTCGVLSGTPYGFGVVFLNLRNAWFPALYVPVIELT
jgi:hypothetical protein